MAIPRQQRLSSKQIVEVIREGERRYKKGIVIYQRASGENQGCVIVGKKVSKRAVDRNRIKRQIGSNLSTVFKHKCVGQVVLRVLSLDLDTKQVDSWL